MLGEPDKLLTFPPPFTVRSMPERADFDNTDGLQKYSS